MKYTILLIILLVFSLKTYTNQENKNLIFSQEERYSAAHTRTDINKLFNNITNPIGLKKTKNKWNYKISKNNTKFERFKEPFWGIRAGIINLLNYIKYNKVTTNYEYIYRHNPEKKYIDDFFKLSKLDSTELINNHKEFIISVKIIIFLETSKTINTKQIEYVCNYNNIVFESPRQ